MYEDLFPIDERPQPLLDPESCDVLGKCYNAVPDGHERESLIRRNRRLRYERGGHDVERILTRLISLADGLERLLEMGRQSPEVRESEVLQNWLKMIKGLHRRLQGIMEREGMQAVESVGKPLDLDLHEVVGVEGQGEEGRDIVVAEQEKAYVYDNRVVRDAKVVVKRLRDAGSSSRDLREESTKEG